MGNDLGQLKNNNFMLNLTNVFSKFGQPVGFIHSGSQLFHHRRPYLLYSPKIIWIEPNQFFYDYGLTMINPNYELIFKSEIKSDNNLENLLSNSNININDYNYLHISTSAYMVYGLSGYESFLPHLKYVSIEFTRNIDNTNSDFSTIDRYLKSHRFKLVESRTVDNIGQSIYIKKRNYNKKTK